MAKSLNLLAFDLGAESGRAMLGQFDGERLALDEIHRFPNVPARLPTGLHWDVLNLWTEINQGLARGFAATDGDLTSLGLDTWGVDFALLDQDGTLLANPYHYRDSRTDGMLDEAFQRLPREEIFEQTGIQFLPINTLYQLLAMVIKRSPLLTVAQTFLTIPDLFNYWLTGRKVCEFSNATTTQCYDPRQADWARPMLEALKIPSHIFPEVVPPGTILGELSPALATEAGGEPLPVIAPACHDTGSAVAAVPAQAPHFAWISSGTWSIIGAEVPEPIIDAQSLTFNLTNEGGVEGTFRFSRNVMGLWLVQECRRTWARQGRDYSYDELTQLAAAAEPFQGLVDPDYGDFLPPGDMPARIRSYCEQTGQTVPEDEGAIVRSALESLALKYRWVLERIETILGRHLEPIYVVGGGAQNRLLCQFTADATGRPVVTGPVEATAAGNVLVQALALGHVDSLHDGRAIVRRSFDLSICEPSTQAGWEEAYGRFSDLVERTD